MRFVREHLSTDWELLTLPDPDSPELLRTALVDADMLLSMDFSDRFPPAPTLKLLQLPGAGYDRIDFEAVPPAASICNVFEHEIGIAEYLVLTLLEWEIRVRDMDAALREGRWVGGFVDNAPLHGELMGKTVGFLGYGRIARETAKRLQPFGVRTIAVTRREASRDEHLDAVSGPDGLLDMMREADVVIVCCPLTDSTRGLVDEAALEALGPNGVIVNVGRGPIIDEDALWATLDSGRLGGAIIDTWYRYPTDGNDAVCQPSRHPFHRLRNVIMTPHASGWSAGLLDRRWRVITDNMNRLARGEPLVNLLRGAD